MRQTVVNYSCNAGRRLVVAFLRWPLARGSQQRSMHPCPGVVVGNERHGVAPCYVLGDLSKGGVLYRMATNMHSS